MKYILLRSLAGILTTALLISAASAQQKGKQTARPAIPGVAVVNFTNNSGDASLLTLSSSIPEAISASISNTEGIRVLDRANLGKVLEEVALQQTGLFEGDTSQVKKLIKADIIIAGSIGGSRNNLVITIKAVEVATGKILDGKVVSGKSNNIHDLVSLASLSMAAIISGKNIGFISVSTNPDAADVFIDGVAMGKSPIVDYKVAAGDHRITVTKANFIDAETSLWVEANGHAKWEPSLPSKAKLDRMEIGIVAYGFMPFSDKVQNGYIISPYIGQRFEHLYLGASMNIGYMHHDQTYNPVFNYKQERDYLLTTAALHLNVIPFQSLRYFSPYLGGFVEAGWISASHKVSGDWKKEDYDKDGSQFLYGVGGTVGINLLPYSKVSIFAECNVHLYLSKIYRSEYGGGGIMGAPTLTQKQINLSGLSIGGGLKYYFD
jgi:TolB-like protein